MKPTLLTPVDASRFNVNKPSYSVQIQEDDLLIVSVWVRWAEENSLDALKFVAAKEAAQRGFTYIGIDDADITYEICIDACSPFLETTGSFRMSNVASNGNFYQSKELVEFFSNSYSK